MGTSNKEPLIFWENERNKELQVIPLLAIFDKSNKTRKFLIKISNKPWNSLFEKICPYLLVVELKDCSYVSDTKQSFSLVKLGDFEGFVWKFEAK